MKKLTHRFSDKKNTVVISGKSREEVKLMLGIVEEERPDVREYQEKCREVFPLESTAKKGGGIW